MDAKAMAKSKKSYSQYHNKKSHPSQHSRTPPDSGGSKENAKKSSLKQVKEGKMHQKLQGLSSLPSNWDRYEEECGPVSEDLAQKGTTQYADATKRKSRGADYGYLVSEAQARFQQQQMCPAVDSFASSDDIFPDFSQIVDSMLSVRGQGILASIEDDDNFIVEDKAPISQEVPFLSLNLHALAEKLSKVDISKRLFIEDELISLELRSEECEAASSTFEKPYTFADMNSEVKSSELKLMSQVKDEPEHCEEAKESKISLPTRTFSVDSVSGKAEKAPKFEVSAAEAELDMLLNSFSQTSLSNEADFKKPSKASFATQQRREGRVSSENVLFAPGYGSPDLGETSRLRARDGGPSRPQNVKGLSLDATVDDLLGETPVLTNRNGSPRSLSQKVTAVKLDGKPSASSSQNSELFDDFDSWLDTIS